MGRSTQKKPPKNETQPDVDWRRVARLVFTSRAIDELEETELYPARKIVYQFSARGHELSQVLLGSLLTHPHDGVGAYYRSRPLLLTLGLPIEDALAAPLGKSGGYSDGRDIGAVCNMPSRGAATVLPMAGDVGSQYTPSAGWAESIQYHHYVLGKASYQNAIAVVLGGEGSVATNGFWSALTMATTLSLPLLFFIEDNGFAISVPSDKQTPGGNIADNVASFRNLHVIQADGTDPVEALQAITEAVNFVRLGEAPALLRLTVPRLCGHSGQDTQAYKSDARIEAEKQRDPLERLRQHLVPKIISAKEWSSLETEVRKECRAALSKALARPDPDSSQVRRFAFADEVRGEITAPPAAQTGARINMLEAIRRVLQSELERDPRVVVFGEDVGPKGGVHAATLGLQEQFGVGRVFDTSLSEEGIIGRAVGMALSGLRPVAEIQFRKYADPATEQLNNCGTIRWRTANRFAAPIVVRIPGGFSKIAGDPWHSVSGESVFAHAIGWQVAMPSNAEDATGLLRTAIRSGNPTIFFEHRALLDTAWARRPYPGDQFILPFGVARTVREGNSITVISWGAMVERCEGAIVATGIDAELIDLRTISPWDREAVINSVKKTHRCLIVHEDNITAGFGAEISATVSSECFANLDAPVKRIATPDIPVPYNVTLLSAVVPSVEFISQGLQELATY